MGEGCVRCHVGLMLCVNRWRPGSDGACCSANLEKPAAIRRAVPPVHLRRFFDMLHSGCETIVHLVVGRAQWAPIMCVHRRNTLP
jgi:hypothetical protein